MNSKTVLQTAFATACWSLFSTARADVTFEKQPDRIRVLIDGQIFTEYRHAPAPKVYYAPVFGPGQLHFTRQWPWSADGPEQEAKDHPHHRGMWFSHGSVNGSDFWGESGKPLPPGAKVARIEHESVLEATGGAKAGTLRTRQKWVAPDESIPLHSEQTLRVYEQTARKRMFDWEIRLIAGGAPVVFGDTKEGTTAIRIAETMRIKTADKKAGAGHMLNSEGDKDSDVWSKRAKWVHAFGPVDSSTGGILFMEHPANALGHRWHARDYGLFAHNPFASKGMISSESESGAYTLEPGKELLLRYRMVLHTGELDAKAAAALFEEYRASNR
jgi:hypothetical protein